MYLNGKPNNRNESCVAFRWSIPRLFCFALLLGGGGVRDDFHGPNWIFFATINSLNYLTAKVFMTNHRRYAKAIPDGRRVKTSTANRREYRSAVILLPYSAETKPMLRLKKKTKSVLSGLTLDVDDSAIPERPCPSRLSRRRRRSIRAILASGTGRMSARPG